MKQAVVTLICLLTLGLSHSALADGFSSALQQLAAKPVVRAQFQQSKTIANSSKPMLSKGSLLFVKNQGVLWQLSSPVSLPGGLVGVSANLPGLGLVAVTGQFRVLVAAPAAAPVPVPMDAGWALALLGTLMGGVAWRRSKRSTSTAS